MMPAKGRSLLYIFILLFNKAMNLLRYLRKYKAHEANKMIET